MLVEHGRDTGYLSLSELDTLYQITKVKPATDQVTDKFIFRKRYPESPTLLAVILGTRTCHEDEDLSVNGSQPAKRKMVARYPVLRTQSKNEFIVHTHPLLERAMASQSNFLPIFAYACSAELDFLLTILQSRRDNR